MTNKGFIEYLKAVLAESQELSEKTPEFFLEASSESTNGLVIKDDNSHAHVLPDKIEWFTPEFYEEEQRYISEGKPLFGSAPDAGSVYCYMSEVDLGNKETKDIVRYEMKMRHFLKVAKIAEFLLSCLLNARGGSLFLWTGTFRDNLEFLRYVFEGGWARIANALREYFRRRGKRMHYFVWVEFQQRGVPHLHALVWVEGKVPVKQFPKLDEGVWSYGMTNRKRFRVHKKGRKAGCLCYATNYAKKANQKGYAFFAAVKANLGSKKMRIFNSTLNLKVAREFGEDVERRVLFERLSYFARSLLRDDEISKVQKEWAEKRESGKGRLFGIGVSGRWIWIKAKWVYAKHEGKQRLFFMGFVVWMEGVEGQSWEYQDYRLLREELVNWVRVAEWLGRRDAVLQP